MVFPRELGRWIHSYLISSNAYELAHRRRKSSFISVLSIPEYDMLMIDIFVMMRLRLSPNARDICNAIIKKDSDIYDVDTA